MAICPAILRQRHTDLGPRNWHNRSKALLRTPPANHPPHVVLLACPRCSGVFLWACPSKSDSSKAALQSANCLQASWFVIIVEDTCTKKYSEVCLIFLFYADCFRAAGLSLHFSAAVSGAAGSRDLRLERELERQKR